MKLKYTFVLACLGATPLWAQQLVEKPEVRRSEKASASESATTSSSTAAKNGDFNPRKPQSTRRPGPPPPQEDQKPVAYIGVLTREVPPELQTQFSLPEGFGLMVDEVMPDSPAQSAGLKMHDILVKFDDQQLVNMEQLMALVRAKKKGDVVNLAVITHGKETTMPVTLGEHMVAANQHRVQYGFGGWPQGGMPFFNGEAMGGAQNQGREFGEHMDRFQKEMREFQQRMQEWAKSSKQEPMPQPPIFNMPGHPSQGRPRNDPQQPTPPSNNSGGNTTQLNFSESHANANITRRDDSGEYTLTTEDGKSTFTARPNDGKEQSWPVNTDDERKAVPEPFRDKLRMMNGANGSIRIEVRPNPGHDDKTDAPRPKAKGVST